MTRLRYVRPHAFTAFLLGAILASSCTKGPSYGSANGIIAVVDSALMAELEPVLVDAFEREVRTTRLEPVFEVTFTTPETMGEFRQWRRLIVIEPLDGATLVPDLADPPEAGPLVAEVDDEWARDQTIWVLAAETPAATVELVRQRADSLYEVMHERYVEREVARMWASERDSALYRSLVDSLGFGIVLPNVYRPAPGSAPADSRVWFSQEPRRIVSIHWTARPDELSADSLLSLRRAWGREVFPEDSIAGSLPGSADTTGDGTAAEPPDAPATAPGDTAAVIPAMEPEPVQVERTTLGGQPAVRLQGAWRGTTGTNAGVFLTYGVLCGDALVMLDGNLFAPDRPKYPYLIQLEQIFSTFHCARE